VQSAVSKSGGTNRVAKREGGGGADNLDCGHKTKRSQIDYRLSAQNMKGNVIKEHDRIVLKTDVPDKGLKAGDVGTVVHVYRDGLAYEVEFTMLDGDTAAVVTVAKSRVRPVRKREITHARELQTA
jgi:Domain of unknown function (DUF4926)